MIIKSNMTPAELMAFAVRLFHVARVAKAETRYTVTVAETSGQSSEITGAWLDDCASIETLNFGAFGDKAPAVEVVDTGAETAAPYLPPYRVTTVASVTPSGGLSPVDHAAINAAHLEPRFRADCAGNEVQA